MILVVMMVPFGTTNHVQMTADKNYLLRFEVGDYSDGFGAGIMEFVDIDICVFIFKQFGPGPPAFMKVPFLCDVPLCYF